MNVLAGTRCHLSIWISLVVFLCSCADGADRLTISVASDDPRVSFAVAEIKTALAEKGHAWETSESAAADIYLAIQADATGLKPQGFDLKQEARQVQVTGHDAAGLMYGGLELAEQIRVQGWDEVTTTTQNPYMELRGTKFNIPLDVRTPSYTDMSDAAQQNIAEMWSLDFWQAYLDKLARDRYNFVSLWSLHPFPSLVQVPDYPDIALDDVQRSTHEWEEYYSTRAIGFDAPEVLANPETLLEITIEEKIAFWQKVMRYAKARNIDFYLVTWNIFVNGTEGKYGITDAIDNETTRDYFRKSVKQLFVTYPDLAGVGLTTGENMRGASTEAKEDWAYATYAQGLLDAADDMPDRKFTFIHRQHMTGARAIAEKFEPLTARENIDFLFSFKYAKAHVYSALTQPYHERFVEEIEGMKTIWTLRNDDIYHFRWGAPDFVRTFIRNIPYEVSRGYYYGSDQWVWGREFLTKDASNPRQIEVEKHWYHWLLWGRLGYNPDLSNERLTQILQHRYPEVNATDLFTAWQEASMIYPTTTGFHWGALDFQWYIEACKSRPGYAQNETGFHDVNRFISLGTHPHSGFQSIPDFVAMTAVGADTSLLSPFGVVERLHGHADRALQILEELQPGDNRELAVTLHDIRTMAYLGKYYAHKIAGAAHLAQFRASQGANHQQAAVNQLQQALEYWKKYTAAALQQNHNPLWTNRVGYVDWVKITEWVEQDIVLAQQPL